MGEIKDRLDAYLTTPGPPVAAWPEEDRERQFLAAQGTPIIDALLPSMNEKIRGMALGAKMMGDEFPHLIHGMNIGVSLAYDRAERLITALADRETPHPGHTTAIRLVEATEDLDSAIRVLAVVLCGSPSLPHALVLPVLVKLISPGDHDGMLRGAAIVALNRIRDMPASLHSIREQAEQLLARSAKAFDLPPVLDAAGQLQAVRLQVLVSSALR